MVKFTRDTPSAQLRLPSVDTEGDAPRIQPAREDKQRYDYIARRMTGTRLRGMAPELWKHLLRACQSGVPRSDGQRGRWSEYRVRVVHDRVGKAVKARLSPPALAAALLEVAEANGVKDAKLEAICGLLTMRRDPGWKK